MSLATAGLLLVALLGQGPQRTYYWRDAAGQTHITNTPPPADAETLEAPQAPALEPGQAGRRGLIRPSLSGDLQQVELSPQQQQAWEALDKHLAKARAEGSRRTLEAVTDSLIEDCLWGSGLWAMALLPLLAVGLMGLLGWWLALGLRSSGQIPLIGGFILLGLAVGHLLLNVFPYNPQAARVHQNLELLERHMGTGRTLRPEYRALLQHRYQALEQAADPLQPPWRFPAEVRILRETMKQVMVEP